jgi:large subunit ribosomal protein L20
MRIKSSVARNKRKKRLFKLTKGYYGEKKNRLRMALQQLGKSLVHAYVGRKDKKGGYRQTWIVRINAAANEEGLNYSKLMSGLKKAGVTLNRKMISGIALSDPESFKELAAIAKNA